MQDRLQILREGINRLEQTILNYNRQPGFDLKGRNRAIRLYRMAKRRLKKLEKEESNGRVNQRRY